MLKNKMLGIPCNLGSNRSGTEFCIDELKNSFPEIFQPMEEIVVIRQKEDFTQKNMKYKNTVFEMCRTVAQWGSQAIKEGFRPIFIGGDHSFSMGSVSSVAKEKTIGVIWIDAHGDMNTDEITESGHIHGMSLAVLLGLGDQKFTKEFSTNIGIKNAVVLGARDLDIEEENLMNKIGLKTIPFQEVQKKGLTQILEEIKSYLHGDELHISFDLDSVNPEYSPAVNTPVEGGFTPQEIFLIFDYLYNNYKISSVDIVELNPAKDQDRKTAKLVCQLVQHINTKN